MVGYLNVATDFIMEHTSFFFRYFRPPNILIEPILKEPGKVAFKWMEIKRTKAFLSQQLDMQANFTGNDTYLPDGECEYQCPELGACIANSLWCDGNNQNGILLFIMDFHVFYCLFWGVQLIGIQNCPSGHDESESQCGAARRILELPGGVFAAMGCVFAAIAACLIFCIFGITRRGTKKQVPSKPVSLNGTLKKEFRKDSLFMDPGS